MHPLSEGLLSVPTLYLLHHSIQLLLFLLNLKLSLSLFLPLLIVGFLRLRP